MRLLRARSASRILRRAFETASEEATLREGAWIIAGHEVARVRAGGLAIEASGKKASGVSETSLSEAGRCRASRGSYSKTSGMLPNVGAKVEERGESAWGDIWVGLVWRADCFPLRCGGGGREAFFLGVRGKRGMEAGVVDQKGRASRLEIVCFPGPRGSRESHGGAEKRSMTSRCHQRAVCECRAEVKSGQTRGE